jgi:hypothetical protein
MKRILFYLRLTWFIIFEVLIVLPIINAMLALASYLRSVRILFQTRKDQFK